jgi:cell division protein ZipA
MQKELQFTLSIIGILIIGGVLLHGLWTIRKNGKKQKKSRLESRNWDPGFEQEDAISGEAPIYDDIGVGKARVVINNVNGNDKVEAQVMPEDAYEVHDDAIETASNEFAPRTQETPLDTSIDFTPIRETSEHENTHEIERKPLKEEHTMVDEVEQASDFAHLDTLPSIDELTETEEPVLLEPDEDEITKIAGVSVSINDEEEVLDLAETKTTELSQESIESMTEDIGSLSQEQNAEKAFTLDVEDSKNESESAVYSNVVTQPKPEFSRPILTNPNLDNSFGHPPEFLLRKDKDESAEEVESANAQSSASTEAQTPVAEDITSGVAVEEPKNPSTDFSLNIQEGPEVKVDVDEESKADAAEKDLSFTEQAKRFVRRNKKTVGEKIRKDPVLKDKSTEDQMRIDFDESQEAKTQEAASKASSPETNTSSSSTKAEVGETDVLVLNIRSTDENPIQGASLLPMLLTLGFKFGEHDIFHRHVNTNGKGPILFSLTNMFKPGVFDIDNIENFSTYGLSLFMMLPIEGDAQQVFNMMHNAARKLSEEFGCRILDGNKVGVSKQSMQQYVERIREFERKRINK